MHTYTYTIPVHEMFPSQARGVVHQKALQLPVEELMYSNGLISFTGSLGQSPRA